MATALTSFQIHILPQIRGVEWSFAIIELRKTINEFLRRSRTWRIALAPISLKCATITAATQANPVQLTAIAHGLATGDVALIGQVLGMTELNGFLYSITVVDPDHFTVNVNGAGFHAYTSGGLASLPVYAVTSPDPNGVVCDVLQGHTPSNMAEDSLTLFGGMPSGGGITLASPSDLDTFQPGWRYLIGGTPRWAHMYDESRVRLVPAPGQPLANATVLEVALELAPGATSMDDGIYRRYDEIIAKGARAKLLEMSDKPWYDAKRAAALKAEFDNDVYEAALRARKGKVKAVTVARPVSYGGM